MGMIPAQAVEAAAKAVYEDTFGKSWADESEAYRNELRETQRLALEAAAPYMLGAAWDEGYEQADSDAPHAIKSENPYRDQVAAAKDDLASLPDGSVVRDMVKDGGNWYYIGSGRIVPKSDIQEDKA